METREPYPPIDRSYTVADVVAAMRDHPDYRVRRAPEPDPEPGTTDHYLIDIEVQHDLSIILLTFGQRIA